MFTPQDEGFADRVRASFARQRFMATLGATLDLVEPGRVVISAACDERLGQQHGFLHAGVVASLLDSACGYAAFSLMPADAGVLTVAYTINLIAPATGDATVATGEVMRAGNTITACRGIAACGERTVAAMQATIMTVRDHPDVQG